MRVTEHGHDGDAEVDPGPAGCTSSPALQERLAELVRSTSGAQGEGPGAGILGGVGGAVQLDVYCRCADGAAHVCLGPALPVFVASVGKSLTAAGVLLLAEGGHVRLEDDVTGYYPALRPLLSGVRILHLLQHTSGLGDYAEVFDDGVVPDETTNAQLVSLLAERGRLSHPAGAAHRYSNLGYVLLAGIIEQVSGQRYGEFMHARILGPLGMRDTFVVDDSDFETHHRAASYARQVDGGAAKTCVWRVVGPGGFWSTARDLSAWDRGLWGGKLLCGHSLESMFTGGMTTNGQRVGYGLGWFVGGYNGRSCAWLTGRRDYFTSSLMHFMGEDMTVIVLSNTADIVAWRLAGRISDLIGNSPPS